MKISSLAQLAKVSAKEFDKVRLDIIMENDVNLRKEIEKLIFQARQEEKESGKYWYFDGDDLVIEKGGWVIDRYKKHKGA